MVAAGGADGWKPDVLGDGYEQLTIDLEREGLHGPLFAALVRSLPSRFHAPKPTLPAHWRPERGFATQPGWLAAILQGHARMPPVWMSAAPPW